MFVIMIYDRDIYLYIGKEGQLSRILNERFTPVTHKLLTIAAPGK